MKGQQRKKKMLRRAGRRAGWVYFLQRGNLQILKAQSQVLRIQELAEGLPRGTRGKESACPGRRHNRHGSSPWVGKNSWRRAGQPTPVFLSGASHGQRSLAGYSPWGPKESDTTEHAGHVGARQ